MTLITDFNTDRYTSLLVLTQNLYTKHPSSSYSAINHDFKLDCPVKILASDKLDRQNIYHKSRERRCLAQDMIIYFPHHLLLQ